MAFRHHLSSGVWHHRSLHYGVLSRPISVHDTNCHWSDFGSYFSYLLSYMSLCLPLAEPTWVQKIIRPLSNEECRFCLRFLHPWCFYGVIRVFFFNLKISIYTFKLNLYIAMLQIFWYRSLHRYTHRTIMATTALQTNIPFFFTDFYMIMQFLKEMNCNPLFYIF